MYRAGYMRKLAADTLAASCGRALARRAHGEVLATATLSSAAQRVLETRNMGVRRAKALRIQSVVRGHMDRAWLQSFRVRLSAHRATIARATRIQAVTRGHFARNAAGEIRVLAWAVAATRVGQASVRRALAQGKHAANIEWMLCHQRALTLQCFFRIAWARRELEAKEEARAQLKAVRRVQPVVRGHAGRMLARARAHDLLLLDATVVLQATLRAAAGRERMAEMRLALLQHRAATAIQVRPHPPHPLLLSTLNPEPWQAGGRGMRDRARVHALREAERRGKASVWLQAGARGMKGRAVARDRREARRRDEAAVLVQVPNSHGARPVHQII